MLSLMLSLMVTSTLAQMQKKPALNGDEELGKIVEDTPPVDEDGGVIDPDFVPEMALPFTEEEERKRTALSQQYSNDNLGLQIDSIEPEGGPITGETRVLVRGGPFEDMTLLYPKPKCKFGANDRVVEATYVKCHTSPLKMEDNEGKSKDKVSEIYSHRFRILTLINKLHLIEIMVPVMRQQSSCQQALNYSTYDFIDR